MSPLARLEQFRRRGVARTMLGLLSLAFVALTAVAVASILTTNRTRSQSAWVAHTYEVLQASSEVLSQVLDAETSQRAYLLTHERSYLDHYEPALRAIPGQIDRLARLTADNARQRARVERLRMDIAVRSRTLQHNVELADHGRIDEALAGIRSGRGRQQMREVRALVGQIQAEERGLLAVRLKAVSDSSRTTLITNLASLVLIIVVAAASIGSIRRYVMDLQASRGELDRLNRGLETAIANRTEQLTRANEEIQRFAYIVSHDLRAPLVNIMGYTAELQTAGTAFARQVETLEQRRPELVDAEARVAVREDIPEAIEFIRASTSKMDRLINAILKLSRDGRRVLSGEPLDMTRTMQAIADSLKHQTTELGATITVEPLPPLVSDRLAIDQVFGNLLDNAVKYLEPTRRGQIVVRGRSEDGWLVYEVADNGRGVAPKDHERVFELFRRAGVQNVAGEGLGLAFVRNSVRRLGGTIELESELGRGSTFRLKFPKAFAQPAED